MRRFRKASPHDKKEARLPVPGEFIVTVRRSEHHKSNLKEHQAEGTQRFRELLIGAAEAEARLKKAGKLPDAYDPEADFQARSVLLASADLEYEKLLRQMQSGPEAEEYTRDRDIRRVTSLLVNWKGEGFDELPVDGKVDEDLVRRVWFSDEYIDHDIVPNLARIDDKGNIVAFVEEEDDDFEELLEICEDYDERIKRGLQALEDDYLEKFEKRRVEAAKNRVGQILGDLEEVVLKTETVDAQLVQKRMMLATTRAQAEAAISAKDPDEERLQKEVNDAKQALREKLEKEREDLLRAAGVMFHPYGGVTFREFYVMWIKDVAVEAEKAYKRANGRFGKS